MKPGLKTTSRKLIKKIRTLLGIMIALIMPAISIAQEPGSNPDIPLDMTGVPIDWRLNVAFLALAVALAVFVIRRRMHKATLK